MKKIPAIQTKTFKVRKLVSEDNNRVLQGDLFTPLLFPTDQELIFQILQNLVHGINSINT
jgi:hypothetical protein